ncbi:cytochrome P450 [Apodospora peruviana]|uniref:Cytochrome P450 monooxygenase ABA1 n=1 Tax=Apodospora peruviana TaxID=516989 RepID=A0AAE0IGX1_9PEZI|nr:cytochrome P450 [Apodospora peruviana]
MAYLILALTALVAYYILSSIIAWYRLRHFKGPFLASFSYLWLAKTTTSGTAWKTYFDLQEKHNEPLVRIGPDFLMTNEPEIIRRMNAARSPYRKDPWYHSFKIGPYDHNMLSTTDETVHADLKAKVTPAYSGKDVPGLEPAIDSQIASFKNLVRSKYLSTVTTTKAMDLGRTAQYFTLDTITKIAFSKEWGFLEANDDFNSFMASFRAGEPLMMLCCDVPWARKIFMNKFMLKLMGPKETDPVGFGAIMGITKKVVGQRFQDNPEKQPDMLQSFIRHGLTQKECEAEVPTLIIAGSDTTAGVLRGGLLYLMTTPSVYQRLQAEVDDAIASGKASSPITSAEAKALPYLQAVVYESMRIHPPNQIFVTKVVPPEGDTLMGKFVPGGTKIGVNLLSVMRHKGTFGDDAYLYRPERFLEVDEKKRTEMERHSEFIFGYGRYMCSGKLVALMELNKMIFEIVRDFDIQLVNPTNPWTKRHYSVFQLSNFWVRMTERQK